MRYFAFMFLAFFLLPVSAMAHKAPTGWQYPVLCCSNQDCKEVADADVKEVKDGYQIVQTGEIVPYRDQRIKDSPDGVFHWCSRQSGEMKGHTICLFVPPRGF